MPMTYFLACCPQDSLPTLTILAILAFLPLLVSPIELSVSSLPPAPSLFNRLYPEASSGDRFCAYERLEFSWSANEVPADDGSPFEAPFELASVAEVELVKEEERQGANVQVVPLGHSEDEGVLLKRWELGDSKSDQEDTKPWLSCDSNGGPGCTIVIQAIQIEEHSDGTTYTHRLVLKFNADVDVERKWAKMVERSQVL